MMINENEFLKELSELVKKYELKHCVFIADDKDEKMNGFFAIEKFEYGATIEDTVVCALNVARIYQSAREKLFYTLDKFARG